MSTNQSRTAPPSLSVVIPVFNEEQWIVRSVGAIVEAAAHAEWPVEVIVVDDGSTDGTPASLAGLAAEYGITVLSQPNLGRFDARKAGMAKASGELLMLLDSRVIVERTALAFLRDQVIRHPERRVWNGHVNVASKGNPYAAFMAAMVKIPWRRYCANPRLMSYGIEEFDVFPKGTTYFCAPKALFEEAATAFESLYDDVKLSSDDTKLLRWIAEREQIWLAPELACTYHGRESLKRFVKHAYFRGTTYVDGYLKTKGPARRGLVFVLAFGLAALGLLVRKPKLALTLGVAVTASTGAATSRFGATAAEARAFALLLPLFGFSFFAGAVRGLALVAKASSRK
jgi:glycosyltransferase involved in cell wall biosynthesis